MTLNDKQIEALLAPLSPGRVRSLSGNSHLEAWDIRRWLIRVFGWGGWSLETLECACISERSVWNEQNPLNGRHTVVYRVQVRLIIKDPGGNVLAHFDDGATGDGINQPSLQKAHDFALKTAMSQALKRVAVNCGDTFGLSLYDRGKAGETTVGRSLAHSVETAHVVREDVKGGEMDEQIAAATGSSSDWTPEDAGPVPSPAPDAGISLPADGTTEPDPADLELYTAQEVEALREAVINALAQDKREAAKIIARLQVQAGTQRLMDEMTVSPKGDAMTVRVYLDEAVKSLSRRQS